MAGSDGSSPQLPFAPPDASAAGAPAGWYPDPYRAQAWRWFDGTSWSPFASDGSAGPDDVARRPRLPRFLSPPVLVCGVLVALMLLVIAIEAPWAAIAGLVPLVIVLPVLSWLDRVEPEPRSSKVHAMLWGATVAVTAASVVNPVVGVLFGDLAAMLGSAPLVEEAAKALGIVWAVRRRDVDGVTDGIVYAGWVAVGFAVVEDITYFAIADVEGALLPVFVLRAIMTPFAHPLFTFWTGLAIGRAVRQGQRIWPRALWGYGLAVACHAAWNGALVLADVTYDVDESAGIAVILIAMAVFFVLFVAVAVTLFVMRGRERERFVASIPSLVLRYQIAPDEAELFVGDWRHLLRQRRMLDRGRRHSFDRLHASLARLALLHERPGDIDPAEERLLAERLADAVAGFRSAR
jgi:RsiW-degrading membrane proteinase PrsW (M82 family)